ncbi:MAG: GNAT family N-acetyltransferase [Prevotella sp.]|nr:GNAT family N-acetyltransferase [Prevotella sp.]
MEELSYKQAALADYDDFYKIKCDPENVKWSGFASAPDYERMKEWFVKQLESEMRTIYLCYWNGVACGFFYLDKLTDEEFEAASSGVLKEYTGRGIGTWTVKKRVELAAERGAKVISTWVADDNPHSWKRFEKLGFQKTDIQEDRMIIHGGGHESLPQVDIVAEEIGYGVLTEFSGKGIGTNIVHYATKRCEARILCAWVSEINRGSERCFEKNGFEKHPVKQKRSMSCSNQTHDFYFWTKVIR